MTRPLFSSTSLEELVVNVEDAHPSEIGIISSGDETSISINNLLSPFSPKRRPGNEPTLSHGLALIPLPSDDLKVSSDKLNYLN